MSSEPTAICSAGRGRALSALRSRACADFSRGEPAPRRPTPARTERGDVGDVRRRGAVVRDRRLPAARPTCQTCHAAGQQAGDTQLLFTGDAADRLRRPCSRSSTPRRRPASRLLVEDERQRHSGGTIYAAGSPEYQTILQWIQQGAPP